MTAIGWVLVALTAVGFAVPRAVGGFARRADPRLTAGVALLALADLALLPVVWLACLGSGIPVPGLTSATACWPAFGSVTGHHVAAGLALTLLAGLIWHAVAAVRLAGKADPRGVALAACRRQPLPGGGWARVLPAAEPIAYVAGLARSQVVVSEGLLALLSPDEQAAVLAHEAAHVRRGHARLLLLGAALTRTYRWLPGVPRLWALLRRELEATCDDDAARAVGAAPLVSALARITLARTRPGAAAFNDLDSQALRYRIDRLHQPPSAAAGCGRAPLLGLALAAALSWSGCALVSARPGLAGLLACVIITGWLAARPAGGVRALYRRP